MASRRRQRPRRRRAHPLDRNRTARPRQRRRTRLLDALAARFPGQPWQTGGFTADRQALFAAYQQRTCVEREEARDDLVDDDDEGGPS